MKKLRIAQVTNLQESVPPLNKNGLEQVVSYLTEELVAMGHDVTLFATADSKTSAKLIPMWPMAVSRDPYGHLLSRETYSIWTVSEAFLRQNEFDVIHDHSVYIAEHFAKLIGIPVISTIHNPISPVERSSDKYTPSYKAYFEHLERRNRNAVTMVTVSNFQSRKFNEFYGYMPKVIHNGVNLEDFPNSENEGKYFAFLGYITKDKGAAEAIQAVLPTGERLKIAGPIRDDDPGARIYFEEKIKPYLDNRIEYVGPLNYEEKKNFLANAKATLMPIQWDEPFGMVAIESMACGTPVIAWNRAAMPEIIDDGISGYLVNSVEEMTVKIKEVEKLKRSNVRKRVEDKFTIRRMATDYEQLYLKILTK